MSNVTIVAHKVTLKGTVDKVFLETMFFLRIIHSECTSFPDYAEGIAKAVIGI